MSASNAFRSCEDVVEVIHSSLMKVLPDLVCMLSPNIKILDAELYYRKILGGLYESLECAGCMKLQVQEEMRNGQIPLEKYVITKTLTKPPEAYPDSRSQPHVEVS